MSQPPSHNDSTTSPQKGAPTARHVDAINQIFTEFQLAFHNQFHRAFANDEQITMAKQLWLNALKDLSPEQIRLGARRAIKESDYLPSIHSLRKLAQPTAQDLGVPDAHTAYLEACRAPSPKASHAWSHPVVYHAGKASDWFFLASEAEAKAFPVFRHNYTLLCERLLHGEQLDLPVVKALPETISRPLSQEERKARLQQLRDELKL